MGDAAAIHPTPRGVDPEQYEIFLGSLFGVAYAGLALAHLLGLTAQFPLFLRVPLGGFLFCVGPGFALFGLISLFQRSHYHYLTLLVISCSLGFTFNFLANLVVFGLQPALSTILVAYMALVTAGYGVLMVAWKRQGAWLLHPPRLVNLPWLLLAGVLALVMVVVLFHRTPPGFYVEELVVLRKLFDNSAITATNVAFHADEYTTYLFVPFYLMIALVGRYAGVDVFQALSGLWPFTALVSTLCLAAISWVVSGRRVTLLAIGVMALLHALFIMPAMSNYGVVFNPMPDRYALASAVLVPLALFHFLIHLRDQSINVPTFIGLVYLIVEITFIHARETLYFMGVVLVIAGVLAVEWRHNANHLKRVLWVLLVVGAVVFLYRMVNLALQPDLAGYVQGFKGYLQQEFQRGWREHGVWSLFGIPSFFNNSSGPETFDYLVHMRFWRWNHGLGFIPLTLLALPLYVLLADRVTQLYLPAVMACLGLYSLFEGVRLLVGIAVGVPFIFDVFSLLFVLSLVVFVDLARMLSQLVAARGLAGWEVQRAMALVAVLFAVIWLQFVWGEGGAATGHRMLEMGWYLAVLVLVVQQGRRLGRGARGRHRGESLAVPRPAGRWRALAWRWRIASGTPLRWLLKLEGSATPRGVGMAAVVIAVLMVLFTPGLPAFLGMGGVVWGEGFFRRPVTGDVAEGYQSMVEGRLLHLSPHHDWSLPPELIRYIRTEVPELQTWFGGHTLPVMMVSNQYAPVLSFDGVLSPRSFHANLVFLQRLYGDAYQADLVTEQDWTRGNFSDFLTTPAQVERLLALLDAEGVGWIITRPEEVGALERRLAALSRVAMRLALMRDVAGYRVYRLLPERMGADQGERE